MFMKSKVMKLKSKDNFINNATFNDEPNYWMHTIAADNKEQMNFLGLIISTNQNQVGAGFEKINLYDLLVYTNNPSLKAQGALYIFYFKSKTKRTR